MSKPDWALILGVSSGFGASIAKELAADGYHICGVHLDMGPARRSAEELAIAKHLLVVARHRRELYEEIKRAFAGHESVQVILDRRVNQRREKKGQPMLDRRRTERRSRSAIDDQLRTIGWSLVLLDLAKSNGNGNGRKS